MAVEETKATLLGAAARVFARRGYDGASISEITSEAGLTSGAIYAHYGSKAELFVATLRAHMERDLEALLGVGAGPEMLDQLTSIGASFDTREPTEESLLISAVTAARSHPEVADLLVEMVTEREEIFSGFVSEAQKAGVMTDEVSAAALSRLSLIVALGSMIVGALELEPLHHEDWARLMAKLVSGFRA